MKRQISSTMLSALLLTLAGGSGSAHGAGSLDRLVRQLDQRVDFGARGAAPLHRTDLALLVRQGAGVSGELRRRIEQLMIGRMTARGVRSCTARPATARQQALQQARDQGFEWLLDFTASLSHGQLELTGELRRSDALIWRDLLQPERGTVQHLHASIAVDAEIRAFRARADSGRVVLSQQSWPIGDRQLLALRAGDLDGDGRCELVVLYRDGVAVLRAGSRRLEVVASHLFGEPLALPTPRRPFGTLAVGERHGGAVQIWARSSDHGKAAELSFDGKRLRSRRQLAGYPLSVIGRAAGQLLVAKPQSGMDWFARGTLGEVGGGPRQDASGFYRAKSVTLRGKGGRQRLLGLVDVEGQFELHGGAKLATRVARLPRVGLAFDIADLDDDGTLELVTSEGGDPDENDRITIWRHLQTGLRQVWRSAQLAGRVEALAHGDLDGDGKQEIFGAVATPDGRLLLLVLD